MSLAYTNSSNARPRDGDVLESVVWVLLALTGVSFLLYQGQDYLEYLIAPAALILPGIVIWRITMFSRKRQQFNKLKAQLQKTIHTYSVAKQTTDELPPGDRELAARQLEAIKKTGWGICKELSNFRAELRDAKQNVMMKLGEIPSDDLAKKLAPIRVLEVEVDQLLHEFEPIAKAPMRPRVEEEPALPRTQKPQKKKTDRK